MDAKLDAARLEKLVARCNAACESQDFGMAEFLDTADIAVLARCAAAWAKVERERGNGALYINHKTVTWFYGDNDFANGDTAIAAVEAAPEVGP